MCNLLNWTSLILYLFGLLLLSLIKGEQVSLYGADPVGKIWKTEVNFAGNADVSISSKNYIGTQNFTAENINYDPGNNDTSILLDTIGRKYVMSGSVCGDSFLLTGGYKFNDSLNIGAFASFKGIFYFLYISTKARSSKKFIALRSTEGCEKYISFRENNISDVKSLSKKDLEDCSRTVAEIDYTTDPKVFFRPGSNMKISTNGENLTFIFSLVKYAKQTRNRYVARTYVYHVTDLGKISLLHEMELPNQFIEWKIRAILSVDWVGDTVCLSISDRIKCGQLVGNKLKNMNMVINPGEGVIHGICTGTDTRGLALVTGVAIAKLNETIGVFFGCYAQQNTTGGVGLVTYTSQWTDRKIQKVALTDGDLYGGSLLVVDGKNTSNETESKCQHAQPSSNAVSRIQIEIHRYFCCILVFSYFIHYGNL